MTGAHASKPSIPQLRWQDGAAAGTVCLVKVDQLKKNEAWRVQIAPAAIHLDAVGRELPTRNEDWIIAPVTDNEVRLDEAGFVPMWAVPMRG